MSDGLFFVNYIGVDYGREDQTGRDIYWQTRKNPQWEGYGDRSDISLYKYQTSLYGISRTKSARGLCRVLEGSGALDELFNARESVYLFSDELEATIQLTSSGTFRVTGFIVLKK